MVVVQNSGDLLPYLVVMSLVIESLQPMVILLRAEFLALIGRQRSGIRQSSKLVGITQTVRRTSGR